MPILKFCTQRLYANYVCAVPIGTLTSPARLICTSPTRFIHTNKVMAKSRFEYVRQFEMDDTCLPNCWIVVRIDGKSFHRFADVHHYIKPNDERSLDVMSEAAARVMDDFPDIVLAYGQSDEYSFVLHKNTTTYNRRASKLMTNIVSKFAALFVFHWSRYFPSQPMEYPPAFDGRVVLYPTDQNLKDYLSWRQADCHINNLYNTCFWKLVQERSLSAQQAQERLKGTLSAGKNELLFTEFDINYNNLPPKYRKGTVLIREKDDDNSPTMKVSCSNAGHQHHDTRVSRRIISLHCDIIAKEFWLEHPEILETK